VYFAEERLNCALNSCGRRRIGRRVFAGHGWEFYARSRGAGGDARTTAGLETGATPLPALPDDSSVGNGYLRISADPAAIMPAAAAASPAYQ
jgi:hypothetical protein